MMLSMGCHGFSPSNALRLCSNALYSARMMTFSLTQFQRTTNALCSNTLYSTRVVTIPRTSKRKTSLLFNWIMKIQWTMHPHHPVTVIQRCVRNAITLWMVLHLSTMMKTIVRSLSWDRTLQPPFLFRLIQWPQRDLLMMKHGHHLLMMKHGHHLLMMALQLLIKQMVLQFLMMTLLRMSGMFQYLKKNDADLSRV